MSQNNTIDWGLTTYNDALEQQKVLVDEHLKGSISNTLVFTEHHPVYTVGKRIGAQKHLVWDENQLKAQGIEVTQTNRGGDITYHGPGQIVGYGIISLAQKKDLHLYLRDLEQVIINTLDCLGIASSRREGKTGIWLKNEKIAAIGVAVRRWVTYHGFALNVNANLEHFSGIIPCGISAEEGTVTSIEKVLGNRLDLDVVKTTLESEFWKIFKDY